MNIDLVNFNNYESESQGDNPFFHLSDDLICVINDEGKFERVNSSGEKLLGFNEGELKGLSWVQFVHPEDQPATIAQIEKLQEGMETLCFENRYRCKDGSYQRLSWKAIWRSAEKIACAIARKIHPNPPRSDESSGVFFERSLNLFCVIGFDACFKTVNPAWEKILGFSQAQLRSQPFIDFVHPEDHQSTLSEFIKLIQGGKSYSFENRYLCKNGGYRWFLWTATAALEKQGIFAIGHDITDRKSAEMEFDIAYEQTRHFVNELQMKLQSRSLGFNTAIHKLQNEIGERREIEEALKKEREFLKSLLNSVDAGIMACDANGTIALFNRVMREWYGLSEEAISSSEWLDGCDLYLPDGTTPMPKEQIPLFRALNGEVVRKLEMAIAPKSGEKRIVIGSGEPIFDEWGNKMGAVVALHDITESKQKAEALQQSALEKNELIRSLEEQAQQLQQTLQELQRTQTQLIQSEKMSSLGQLVAGVAHEINNPVNFIYGNLAHANDYLEDLIDLLTLYQQYYPNPVTEICDRQDEIDLEFLRMDLPKLLNSMKVGAERIRQIVISLRNFSRLNEAESKRVDIHEGIENTLLILHNRLREKNQHLAIEVVKEYGKLPAIDCYPAQLNQAILNIVSNAIDALEVSDRGDRRPTIFIRTEVVDEEWVAIRIRDNGSGMLPEVKEKIFNPFFTTKPVGKGTGLGLAIAYQIVVHTHGGVLNCDSQPNRGAEFSIQIPIRLFGNREG